MLRLWFMDWWHAHRFEFAAQGLFIASLLIVSVIFALLFRRRPK